MLATDQRYRHRLLRILLPLVLFIMGCPPATPPPEVFIPAVAPAVLTVLGHVFYLAPGSFGSLVVQVQDPADETPMADSRVQIFLNTPQAARGQPLFEGRTDADGLLVATFAVPEEVTDPDQQLLIVAETAKGTVHYQEEVYVGRVYSVLLSTDKPVYQPGQTIHLRSLALDTIALQAAQAQTLTVTVQDPQGNKLLRRELTTSRWGIAAADFVLDSQAPSGDYQITAQMGPVSSSRTVEVKPYTLPRFKVNFQSDRSFYLAGETATGTVDAHYFFGKPVAGGTVQIVGFTRDVGREQIFELSGSTDAAGSYAYEVPIPDYLVAGLEGDTAQVDLEITVIDTAHHGETISESLHVAAQPLQVQAVPESGFLRPDVENIIYLQTTYPDGAEAQTTLTVQAGDGPTATLTTDEYGLTTWRVTPQGNRDLILTVHAADGEGRVVDTTLSLGASGGTSAVLLRPERPVYRIGETLNIDLYVAGRAATVYLDLVKGEQTFGLAALPVTDGLAQASVDVDGSLLGTLELHAYVIGDQGEIVRDRRLILVNPAPAQVNVTADAVQYRPGETATLTIDVSRQDQPMPSVLGISIVDESVFAVGAQDPGFARTYFLLERELLEPRYEIHDFTPLGEGDSPYDLKRESVRRIAAVETGRPLVQQAPAARDLALFGLFAADLAQGEQFARQQAQAASAAAALARAQPVAAPAGQTAGAWGWGPRLFLAGPLLAFAFYDGSRRRRRALVGLLFLGIAAFFWSSCAAPAAAPAAEQAQLAAPAAPRPAPADETTATRVGAAQAQPPRLRQFFPETLFWLPELETDADGRVQVEVPMADSITTWRVSVLASDQEGNLGSAEIGLQVFQEFFVEPDVPRFLTQGDELAIPVSLFNYLDEPQEIRLEVEEDVWFELLDGSAQVVQLGANEVAAAYVPIRVTDFGRRTLQISAVGSRMSDAVLREVEILPDGTRRGQVINDRLMDVVAHEVTIPAAAVPGTASVRVKIYPGVVSQVIDGLEGLLQQPYGCFEQTSSTTYPNVLVLDYLKTTGQAAPRIQLQAEQYINLGYQRLLSFEVPGRPGGFSLFGDPPPWTMLTAYGLMEFTDMARVSYVDPALLERTANFLFAQQRGDGSWDAEGMTVESGWERLGDARLPVTAYIAWALADAGYAQSAPVQQALAFVLAAMQSEMDPYALAIVVNALIAADPNDSRARDLLDTLLDRAERGADGTLAWRSELPTYMGGYGAVASIETTAMVAIALLRAGYRPDAAQQALDYLVSQRDSFGMYYTTQATILALKALLLAAEQGGGGDATITVTLNGQRSQTVAITAENIDVVQQVRFDDIGPGSNQVELTLEGGRQVQVQVVTDYYLPWSEVAALPAADEAMRVTVEYDRTELQVNDTVQVAATVELLAAGQAGTVLVDLGIPPGFSPVTADLDALVEAERIERYELTGRQILIYLTDVRSQAPLRLDYRLRARLPVRALAPASQAYDYYTPERQATAPPQRIQVTLGTP